MNRRMTRIVMMTVLLVPFLTVGGERAAAGASASVASTSLLPVVRLRKLHLVRPDLIQYPIDYEVIC